MSEKSTQPTLPIGYGTLYCSLYLDFSQERSQV